MFPGFAIAGNNFNLHATHETKTIAPASSHRNLQSYTRTASAGGHGRTWRYVESDAYLFGAAVGKATVLRGSSLCVMEGVKNWHVYHQCFRLQPSNLKSHRKCVYQLVAICCVISIVSFLSACSPQVSSRSSSQLNCVELLTDPVHRGACRKPRVPPARQSSSWGRQGNPACRVTMVGMGW